MLENIWSELSYNQKKQLGKYALVFCSGVAAGLLIKKTSEVILEDFNDKTLQSEDNLENQVYVVDSDDGTIFDEEMEIDNS